MLWVFQQGKELTGRSGWNLLRYLNHQQRGNTGFDGFDLYAISDIASDEEVTFDYAGWEGD